MARHIPPISRAGDTADPCKEQPFGLLENGFDALSRGVKPPAVKQSDAESLCPESSAAYSDALATPRDVLVALNYGLELVRCGAMLVARDVTPLMQQGRTAYLVARTESDPRRLATAIRSQVLAVDRDQPISNIATMDEILDLSMGSRRLTMLLLGLFAAVALLLATVGIYGAIAFSGAQRTQELGIRRALGAQNRDIMRLMLGQGLTLALMGSALGIGGALALTRVMRGLLYRISPADPATYIGIALLWIVVALAASYIPARRAARIDPAQALRVG